MSFTKFDDEYSNGQLAQLRRQLSTAMRALTGEEFLIFQPHQDIQWGQRPQDRIRAALAQVYLFIPVITPSYFNDERCREELALFLQRERSLGRDDLILPIRYLPTPKLENPGDDPLAQALATREPVDWTNPRLAGHNAPEVQTAIEQIEVQTAIEQMATHVIAALNRATAPPASSPTPPPPAAAPPPPPSGEQRFQIDLLRRNLQHFMSVEKQLAVHPDDITLQMDRDRTVEAINQSAGSLGLGAYPQDVAALVQATELHADYSAFLEHQRQALVDYQRRLTLQEVSASPAARVTIQMQLHDVAQRLQEIERQQAALITATANPPPLAAPPGGIQTESSVAQAAGRLHAPMLPMAEVHRLLACADAVAQVRIGQVVRGNLEPGRVTGTAWLIAPDLALTCWHVMHARGDYDRKAKARDLDVQAQNCLLSFNFTEIGTGIDYGVAQIECANHDTSHLDYALLRLRDRPDHPLQTRTPLPLDADAPLTSISELYIIQHPRGMQQYGADGHVVTPINQNTRLHYTNNTAEGTSGSPVLVRPHWRVVALHQGATRDGLYGEGIMLRPILDDIRQQRPDIYTEMLQAQSHS
jgi:V8-like Glu-specific endopeptidase